MGRENLKRGRDYFSYRGAVFLFIATLRRSSPPRLSLSSFLLRGFDPSSLYRGFWRVVAFFILSLLVAIAATQVVAACKAMGSVNRIHHTEEKEIESLPRVTPDNTTAALIVNSDPTDPAVPLNLALAVRSSTREPLLEIIVQVGKHPAYPATLFFDKDVKVQLQLPPGLQLQNGNLSWRGDLKGEETGQFQVKVKAVQDMEGTVDASATGHGAGGRIDADTERFYVLVKDKTIKVSLVPLALFDPLKPGTGEQKK